MIEKNMVAMPQMSLSLFIGDGEFFRQFQDGSIW